MVLKIYVVNLAGGILWSRLPSLVVSDLNLFGYFRLLHALI